VGNHHKRMVRRVDQHPHYMTTEQLEERSRRERWRAKGRSRVTHPAHGSVVVPHGSNFAALLNAADVWGCDWLEIRGAEVWAAEPGATAAKMPIHYI
jgi:hypothetical protein